MINPAVFPVTNMALRPLVLKAKSLWNGPAARILWLGSDGDPIQTDFSEAVVDQREPTASRFLAPPLRGPTSIQCRHWLISFSNRCC